MIHPSDIDGWIIAGGASRRMGVDKAALEIGGRTIIEIAAHALSKICEGRISIAGGPRNFAPSLPAYTDEVPELGPLSGLRTALSNGNSEWVAVLSCDMPFVTTEVFEQLASITEIGADAVVPVQPDGLTQPLCALYRRSAVYSVDKDLIEGEDRSMRALLSHIHVRYVSFSTFKDLPNSEHLFVNINTPDDYEKVKNLLNPRY